MSALSFVKSAVLIVCGVLAAWWRYYWSWSTDRSLAYVATAWKSSKQYGTRRRLGSPESTVSRSMDWGLAYVLKSRVYPHFSLISKVDMPINA